MQINQKIFMLVAQEMSVSRAANRAFVSQQCVSDHIKRLEEQYQLKLFHRKPRFALTEAGEILYRSLQKISVIEKNIDQNFEGFSKEGEGYFTMGISSSRAQLLLPMVLPDFYARFPNIKVHFYMEDTHIMEEALLDGKLDILFGVNTNNHSEFSYSYLGQDQILLLISEQMLSEELTQKELILKSRSVDLEHFVKIPFITPYKPSAITSVLKNYCLKHRIAINSSCHISDINTQIALCGKHLGAAFITKMFISNIKQWNSTCKRGEFLYAFPINGLEDSVRLDIVTRKDIEPPNYLNYFKELIKNATLHLGRNYT